MTWKPDICIYHSPCDDGFGAAYGVWKKWGDGVQFVPTNYGLALPDYLDIVGKNVLIADFSFPYETCCEMSFKARSLVIVDHHKTAKADLERLPPFHGTDASLEDAFKINWSQNTPEIAVWFDMEKSGAAMIWEWLHGYVSDPVKLIEDRDLWRFDLEDTKVFSTYLRSLPMEFTVWDDVFSAWHDDHKRNAILNEGRAIDRFYKKKVAEVADTATAKSIGEFESVPVANAPYFMASDVAHELLQRDQDAPFAAVEVHAHGGRTYSLRSSDDREDVSAIAKKFGGGGHRNAAGFRVPA